VVLLFGLQLSVGFQLGAFMLRVGGFFLMRLLFLCLLLF
jgi:hypothetical protein